MIRSMYIIKTAFNLNAQVAEGAAEPEFGVTTQAELGETIVEVEFGAGADAFNVGAEYASGEPMLTA